MRPFIAVIGFLTVLSCGKTKFTQFNSDLEGLQQSVQNKLGSGDEVSLDTVRSVHNQVVKSQPTGPTVQNSAATTTGDKRTDLTSFAQQYVGTPYKFGCSKPEEGFDCSGFINFVYSHFGYDVPRSSKDFEFFGKPVSPDQSQPGDLVLFTGTDADSTGAHIGHIGILLEHKGLKSNFIHASSGKANGVTVSSLASDHYQNRFVKIINVID